MMGKSIQHFIQRYEKRLIWGVFLTFILGSLVYSVILGDRLRFADEEEYLHLARNLIEKGIYTSYTEPAAFRPPGYPYWLALFIGLGADIIILRILNYILLGLTGLLLFKLLQQRSSVVAGISGLIFLLFNPLLFYTAGTLYPQTFLAAGLMAIVYFTFRRSSPSMAEAGVIGIIFGVLLLLAPAMSFVFFYYLGWTIISRKKDAVKTIPLILALCVVVLTPWTMRNADRFQRFVFISSNGGYNLLMGNNPMATPTSGVIDLPGLNEETQDLDEFQREMYCRKKAITYIRSHPLEAVKRYVLKFLNYFHFKNDMGSEKGMKFGGWKTAISFMTTIPLLMFGLLLPVLSRKKIPLLPMGRFILLLYVLNGAFTAIFFTRIRFRLPFDALLIVVAAWFLSRHLEPSAENAS